MADRGITFSAPMVRALLEGRKTQTRRLIQPISGEVRPGDIIVSWPSDAPVRTGLTFRPPHQPGDRLYVREHWKTVIGNDGVAPRDLDPLSSVHYLADGSERGKYAVKTPLGRHRQAMHMPRWASRLWLLVTDVRVQRLGDMSEADAIAEGIFQPGGESFGWAHDPNQPDWWLSPKMAFHRLWDSLHTKPGTRWEDNPWVVAISFTVQNGNIDQ